MAEQVEGGRLSFSLNKKAEKYLKQVTYRERGKHLPKVVISDFRKVFAGREDFNDYKAIIF